MVFTFRLHFKDSCKMILSYCWTFSIKTCFYFISSRCRIQYYNKILIQLVFWVSNLKAKINKISDEIVWNQSNYMILLTSTTSIFKAVANTKSWWTISLYCWTKSCSKICYCVRHKIKESSAFAKRELMLSGREVNNVMMYNRETPLTMHRAHIKLI